MEQRWKVVPRTRPDGSTRWLVADTQDQDRPVASFDDEAAAQAHARRLAEGPFDWDDQEAWKDDDEDEDEDWGRRRW